MIAVFLVEKKNKVGNSGATSLRVNGEKISCSEFYIQKKNLQKQMKEFSR